MNDDPIRITGEEEKEETTEQYDEPNPCESTKPVFKGPVRYNLAAGLAGRTLQVLKAEALLTSWTNGARRRTARCLTHALLLLLVHRLPLYKIYRNSHCGFLESITSLPFIASQHGGMTLLPGACAHIGERWPTASVCRGVQDSQPVEVHEALRREGEVGWVLDAAGASWKNCDCRGWQSLSPVRRKKAHWHRRQATLKCA